MKFLCICQYGHSRSVALTRVLHSMNHGAVAIGWSTNGGAIVPLSEWADAILLMTPEAIGRIPEAARSKVVNFSVGPDIWSNPYDQGLLALLREKVERYFAERAA